MMKATLEKNRSNADAPLYFNFAVYRREGDRVEAYRVQQRFGAANKRLETPTELNVIHYQSRMPRQSLEVDSEFAEDWEAHVRYQRSLGRDYAAAE